MLKRLMTTAIAAIALGGAATLMASAPAAALTMKQCSEKYRAAQADGSAKDIKWNDFRAKECGPDATAEPAAASENEDAPAKPTMAAPKGVSFPTAIDSKYAKESPGKARLHTCVDQYRALKAKDALGGLKWIQKGGGYYSLCNAKLKGGA